jgi:hypothetical protein
LPEGLIAAGGAVLDAGATLGTAGGGVTGAVLGTLGGSVLGTGLAPWISLVVGRTGVFSLVLVPQVAATAITTAVAVTAAIITAAPLAGLFSTGALTGFSDGGAPEGGASDSGAAPSSVGASSGAAFSGAAFSPRASRSARSRASSTRKSESISIACILVSGLPSGSSTGPRGLSGSICSGARGPGRFSSSASFTVGVCDGGTIFTRPSSIVGWSGASGSSPAA